MQCWRDPALHASFFFPRGTPQTTRATRHALMSRHAHDVVGRPSARYTTTAPKKLPRAKGVMTCPHDKRDQVRVRELLHGTTWPVVETRQTEERPTAPQCL